MNDTFPVVYIILFQSPQWGSNSKEEQLHQVRYYHRFQSPQWGSNSKGNK